MLKKQVMKYIAYMIGITWLKSTEKKFLFGDPKTSVSDAFIHPITVRL